MEQSQIWLIIMSVLVGILFIVLMFLLAKNKKIGYSSKQKIVPLKESERSQKRASNVKSTNKNTHKLTDQVPKQHINEPKDRRGEDK